METQEIEIWVAINHDGEINIDTDCAEDAANSLSGMTRVFHLKLTVPLPKATELTGTLPDTDAPMTLTVA